MEEKGKTLLPKWFKANFKTIASFVKNLAYKQDDSKDAVILRLQILKSKIATAVSKTEIDKLLNEYRQESVGVDLPGDLALETIETLAKDIGTIIDQRENGSITKEQAEALAKQAALELALETTFDAIAKTEKIIEEMEQKHQEAFARVDLLIVRIEKGDKIDEKEAALAADEMVTVYQVRQERVKMRKENLEQISRERQTLESIPNNEAGVAEFNDRIGPKENDLRNRIKRDEEQLKRQEQIFHKLDQATAEYIGNALSLDIVTSIATHSIAVSEQDRAVSEQDRAVSEQDRAVSEQDRAVSEQDRAAAENKFAKLAQINESEERDKAKLSADRRKNMVKRLAKDPGFHQVSTPTTPHIQIERSTQGKTRG